MKAFCNEKNCDNLPWVGASCPMGRGKLSQAFKTSMEDWHISVRNQHDKAHLICPSLA